MTRLSLSLFTTILLLHACAILPPSSVDQQLNDKDFCVKLGQEWRYDTREKEQDSRLTIVDAIINKNRERFYVVRVTGVKIDNPHFANYFPDRIPYFLISEPGLNASLESLVGDSKWNKYYDRYYQMWKNNLRNPDYLGGTIKQKLNTLEEILDTRIGT